MFFVRVLRKEIRKFRAIHVPIVFVGKRVWFDPAADAGQATTP
jgi:hypothetical protein